jgi:hypothetical protein
MSPPVAIMPGPVIIPKRRILASAKLIATPIVGHDNISVSVDSDVRSLIELEVSITIDREVSFPINPNIPITIDREVSFPINPNIPITIDREVSVPINPSVSITIDREVSLPINPNVSITIDREVSFPINPNVSITVDSHVASDACLIVCPNISVPEPGVRGSFRTNGCAAAAVARRCRISPLADWCSRDISPRDCWLSYATRRCRRRGRSLGARIPAANLRRRVPAVVLISILG